MAGLLDSIAGGGGIISLPALLAMNVPPHIALGTNKFQATFGTSVALINYGRKFHVVWKVVLVGIPFSLIGSVIGAKTALIISPAILAKIIVGCLPIVLLFLIFSKELRKPKGRELKYDLKFWVMISITCLIIGTYDGFLGPGTGTFLIIALVIFSHMSVVKASATAKTFNLASNVGSLVPFLMAGKVNFTYAAAMALGNLLGGYTGSHLAMKHGGRFVKRVVFIALTLLFIYLIWKYY
ncbi:MAG: TSUP family transporter [Pseudomonadota bacterium]